MPEFELRFVIEAPSEPLKDSIETAGDAIFAEHFGVSTVGIVVEGTDCASAAQDAISLLRRSGIEALRLLDDLVGRSEIAHRARVSRQAVANWLSGKRQSEAKFPAPHVLAEGGLWLWGELLPVLQDLGYCEEDDLCYPTAEDSQKISAMIYANRFSLESLHLRLRADHAPDDEPRYLAAS